VNKQTTSFETCRCFASLLFHGKSDAICSGRSGSALGLNYASRTSGHVIWWKCADVSEEVKGRSRIFWHVRTFLPDCTVSCHNRS